MNETVQGWADRAAYDLETARAMLDGGRYFYVYFCCQQAVEKMLKAVIISETGKLPPRIHNLPRLAEQAGVATDEARLELMARLSAFYLESRYPDTSELPHGPGARQQAETVLTQTEDTVGWLLSSLK